jgi:hypothetical protein
VNPDVDISSRARGYTVVLPPGWARVPLGNEAEGAISKILDRAYAGLSRDQVASARREVQLRLRRMVALAREQHGLDLYLPVERIRGFTLGASFVVAQVSFGQAEPLEPALLVRSLASDADSAPTTIDGALGARAEGVVPGEPGEEAPFASRRVDYVLPVPGDPDRWVLVSFSALGSGDPRDELADLAVELFDAIMSTFRWTASPKT